MIEVVQDIPASLRRAPAVHARRKSVSFADDAVLRKGLDDMTGIDVPTLVMSPDARPLAIAWAASGNPFDRRVRYIDDRALIEGFIRDGHDGGMQCAFSNLNQIISAASNGSRFDLKFVKTMTTNPTAGQFMDLWPVGGDPTAGTYPGAANTAVQKDDTTTGALIHGGNVSTATKHVVSSTASFSAGASPPTLYLYDRVLCYEANAFTAAANQNMTNGVAAARWIGAGEGGLKMQLTGQTVFGATASNLTALSYTDQDGNAAQSMPTTITAVIIVSVAAPTATLGARVACPASGTTPLSPYLFMAAGDTGARAVASYTTSAANTGTWCLSLVRQLAIFPMVLALKTEDFDLTRGLQSLPRVRDGGCLSAFAKFVAATGCNFELDGQAVWN